MCKSVAGKSGSDVGSDDAVMISPFLSRMERKVEEDGGGERRWGGSQASSLLSPAGGGDAAVVSLVETAAGFGFLLKANLGLGAS